jgi:DNA-binding HxlR family transcriptional regulator
MHRLVDGISQKVLTENLRKMESDGIVKREVFPEVPPRVEYSLTDLGDSLRPIINSMSDWGTDYIKNNLLEQK